MIQIGAAPATIDTPIEHLVACHRRIEQRLDTLVNAADYLALDRETGLAAIARSLEFLDSSGTRHTEDEERSVFPRLRAKLTEEQNAYLDSLEAQHDVAEATLERLKHLAGEIAKQNAAPLPLIELYRDCAADLRSLYFEHIHSEDLVLTALARANLTAPDLAAISREMHARRKSP